jgi:Asp-tRNA(Asn)/Glu-tRNA(Gln) amidotransferase A subunit family amidase
VSDVPFAWDSAVTDINDIKKMRIGYLKSEFDNIEGEQKRVYEEALDALKTAGTNLQPMELPSLSSPSLKIIATAEVASAFDDLTRNGEVNTLAGQSSNGWPNIFRTARFVPAVEYLRAQRARTLLMREMDALMSQWDVFVAPAPSNANSLATNMTGHPAVVVPCGFVKGQPQAMVFIGRLYEEATPLRVALAFERSTKWHTMHPEVNE